MPTTLDIYDKEETFALRSYEITLTCGKCRQGQLVSTNQTDDSEATIHVCSHCNREQTISGEPYPRIEDRREPAGERIIIHKQIVPDKDPDEYTQSEVSLLKEDKKVELLQTTRNPVIIDYLQFATVQFVHLSLDKLYEALFEITREAARIRAIGLTKSELDEPLTAASANAIPLPDVVEKLLSTTRPENIDMIQARNYRPQYELDFRVALYDAARQVVAYRKQQSEKPSQEVTQDVPPAKNKGGRPRKNPVVYY